MRPVPASLSAFLRGVERRAALFAEMQCGDAAEGDWVVASAIREFHEEALRIPLADWPRCFWRRLMMSPALKPGAASHWVPAVAHLGTLASGDRKALLSRLAVGLPEDEAAEVLCIDLVRYRAALAAACPRTPDGEPDAEGWRALAEAIQRCMRELPEPRMQRLARLRQLALAPETRVAHQPALSGSSSVSPQLRPARWRAWAVAVVVVLAMGALASTWFWPASHLRETKTNSPPAADSARLPPDPVIATEPLAAVSEPQRVTPEEALASHADLDLLRDPEAQGLAQDAAMYAWYLAGAQSVAPVDATTQAAAGVAVSTEEGRDATF